MRRSAFEEILCKISEYLVAIVWIEASRQKPRRETRRHHRAAL
jgi:hypothetical protein